MVTAKEIPKVGMTLIGEKFSTIPGGKGANQAVAAARMGANTTMIGRVGKDMFGEGLLQSLKETGVHCETVTIDEAHDSGVALISVDACGGNSILVVPGANFALEPRDIDQNEMIIKESSMVVLQHEIPLETVKQAVLCAKKFDKTVVLNPAPAYAIDSAIFEHIDFIIPNEHELSVTTNKNTHTRELQIEAAQSLIHKGVQNVIITLGAEGCLWINQDKTQHFQGYRVNAVDTTAAGDSFIGGFCAIYEKDKNIEKAIEMGQKMAALSVTKKGAQTSIPTIDEIESYWA